eukprot:830008-Prymnesium_polylepis.1
MPWISVVEDSPFFEALYAAESDDSGNVLEMYRLRNAPTQGSHSIKGLSVSLWMKSSASAITRRVSVQLPEHWLTSRSRSSVRRAPERMAMRIASV